MKIKAELAVIYSQSKEYLELLETGKGKEKSEWDPTDTLISDFWPPEL